MKKISSKIIIPLVLAAVLWGGGMNKAEAGFFDYLNALGNRTGAAIGERIKDNKTLVNVLQIFKDPNAQKDIAGGVIGHAPFLMAYGWGTTILGLESGLLHISNAFFNGSLTLSIKYFKQIIDSSGIESVWVIFRNIINVFFIFILLYISIATIIGTAGSRTKSMIVGVIISALFINFSLFFTRLLIDVSNLVAVALFEHNSGGIKLDVWGTHLMNNLNLQSLWKTWLLTGQVALMADLIFKIVLVGLLIKIYFKMAFMMIGRIIMFLILMATSPIAFLGGSIPFLKEKRSDWWGAFTGQLLIAPAFMFLLLIVSALTNAGAPQKINDIAANVFTGSKYAPEFNVGPLIYYILVIGILSAGLKLIETLSGSVGKVVEKVIGAVKSLAVTTVAVGTALATGGATAGLGVGGMASGLITGEIEKETGLAGATGRFARSKFMESTKLISGDKIDLKKMEASYKKAQKDNEDRLMKKIDAAGPGKAIVRKKQIEDTLENVDQHLQLSHPELAADVDASKDLNKDLKKAEIELKKAEVAQRLAATDAEKAAAQTKTDNATRKRDDLKQQINEIEARLLPHRKEAAASMGADMDKLTTELKGMGDKIKEGIESKNAMLANLSKQGVVKTGVFRQKDRDKLLDRARAVRGTYRNDEEDFLKKLRKMAKEESSGEKKKEETT